MHVSRREFLGTTAAAGIAAAAGARGLSARSAPKKILILGGTGFLGPAVVDAAIARGHTVTLFNRGKTEKRKGGLYPDLEKLYGNRDPNLSADDKDPASPKGLESLKGHSWDAVVDTSGFYPRMVKASAELLADHAGQYIFISSISAYAKNDTPNADETAPVGTMDDPTKEEMGAEFQYYGPLKVLCEKAAEAAFAGRALVIRPGYIVGPGDPTDRFTYWPVRASRGGEMLAPGTPVDPVQIIDARDLGEWIVRCIEAGTNGCFNAVGPLKPAPWGELLEACKTAAKSDASFTWVPNEFLAANGLPTGSLPIWLPPTGEYAGFHTWSNARAVKAGLTFRTNVEIARSLLEWWPKELDRRERVTKEMIEAAEKSGQARPEMPDPRQIRAGISAEQEKQVLDAWRASQKG